MSEHHSGDVETILLTKDEVIEIVRDQLRRTIVVMVVSSVVIVIGVVSNLVYFSYSHGKLEQKVIDNTVIIQKLEIDMDELRRQHSEMMVESAKIAATLDRVDTQLEKHIEKK